MGHCGAQTPASVPQPAEGRSSPTNTPVFPSSSFVLLSFVSSIYYFLLLRYSCLISAGFLHAHLCLKVYSRCIYGERYSPHPPTPPPSCLSIQFSSVAQSCPTLCDSMNRSTPGLPVHHQLPELAQTHVRQVGDTIEPSHPLSPPSPPAPNPSQHQCLFQ